MILSTVNWKEVVNIYKDCSYYIGQFKNSLFNGKGIKYDKGGNIKYEGDFIDNEYNYNL